MQRRLLDEGRGLCHSKRSCNISSSVGTLRELVGFVIVVVIVFRKKKEVLRTRKSQFSKAALNSPCIVGIIRPCAVFLDESPYLILVNQAKHTAQLLSS
jgi:hypothetical protein